MGFENRPGRAVQGGAGFHVRALGGDFSRARLRQQAFVLDDEKSGGGANFKPRLLGFQLFLLELMRLDGGFPGSARAAHGN